jgi:hypothetical protein
MTEVEGSFKDACGRGISVIRDQRSGDRRGRSVRVKKCKSVRVQEKAKDNAEAQSSQRFAEIRRGRKEEPKSTVRSDCVTEKSNPRPTRRTGVWGTRQRKIKRTSRPRHRLRAWGNRLGSMLIQIQCFSGSEGQMGLRFSRKEARPSWKSGVQRMRAFSRMARSRS